MIFGDKMYQKNYESLRAELVDIVEKKLSPIALKYNYSQVSLEVNIRWKPIVLVLGNYSSGKSTLINELLHAEIQATGQAPTDDSFTLITNDESKTPDLSQEIKIIEERDGNVLLNDSTYPFENLKKYGEKFSSHFKLKTCNSPFVNDLAIIDTPGMLDSGSEYDRGYDYQGVIGDLAQIADLILVLFDPHKAGTIRESHLSLRETLPKKTFEDRVIFVLNRIDECESLIDFLRVYGTLCWNLSQMTGRKDIPKIYLSYSMTPPAIKKETLQYLELLENEREELKQKIESAPKYRLDHLASYIETHGERLSHFLEAINQYSKLKTLYKLKYFTISLLISFFTGFVFWIFLKNISLLNNSQNLLISSALISSITLFISVLLLNIFYIKVFFNTKIKNINSLTTLNTQLRIDSWAAVKEKVKDYLQKTSGNFSSYQIKKDYKSITKAYKHSSKEVRSALSELRKSIQQ